MKNTLIISTAVSLLITAGAETSAQITITQADFPTIGTVWAELDDDRQNVHTVTPGGAGQTWNYANAFVVNDTTILNFLSPSATPSGGQAFFPNADMAFLSPDSITSTYLKSQNDGFYLDGVYEDTSGLALDLDPDELVIPAPFTFNSSRTHNSVLSVEQPAVPPNPGFLFKSSLVQNFTGDAYGSLTTPAGTYPNTLRMKVFQYSIDSLFLDLTGTGNYTFLSTTGPSDSVITYVWLKNGSGSLLMSIEVDPATNQSTGAGYYQTLILGIEENIQPYVSHYPNPVTGGTLNIIIENPEFDVVTIYDAGGRIVFSDQVRGLNKLKIGTSHYNSGIYFYELSGAGMGPVREKFIIQ